MYRAFLLLILSAVLIVACEDDFATSGDAQPVASADTLHLGTILAGNSSSTYQLKLYNRNSKEIKLTSITLRGAGESGFRMNVDGMNGSSFTQSELLRIASGDSLFMFVEATFPENSGGIHKDYVDVLCNGKTTTIVLDAVSKDVRKLRAHTLISNETWRAEEIQVLDSLVVPQGMTLTLTDSTTLYFHDKANFIVYGSLVCKGTKERPVTIRGDRTDWMFDNLPYDNLPSQWGSLYLRAGSKGNSFERTDIHGMSEGIFVEEKAEAKFTNCHLKNSNGSLLSCLNAKIEMQNCELKNSGLSLLDIAGGEYDILHCTLANFHFASVIRQEALRLSNRDTINHIPAPLHRFNIVNSIVWGKRFNPEIVFDYEKPAESDSIFSYMFDHCLLLADGADDEDFIATKWNEDPLFLLLDPDNYTFDLHLQEESPCRGNGNPDVRSRVPLDLDGKERAENPSIGCYE